LFERLTVQRLSWDSVVRLNRYLELTGKLATAIWVAFICSLVFGLEWKQVVEAAINSGKPLENAFAGACATYGRVLGGPLSGRLRTLAAAARTLAPRRKRLRQ
jgi:hypothetical protein